MMRVTILIGLVSLLFVSQANAEVVMKRVLSCKGDGATMEIFLPLSAVKRRGATNAELAEPIIGAYTLDLTEAGKGKILESVRIGYTADRKAVIIDQFTRKLPPTRVPISGGTINFDNRFATNAKCSPFNEE
jgi:hypothetical protein